MRVFVTGATGFIGSHVVGLLVDQGHEVVAMVRKTSDTSLLDRLQVETVIGSMGEARRCRSSLAQADAVIHIAGVTGAKDKSVLYRVNAEGTRDLVDEVAGCVEPGTPFVYVSSVSAQGPSQDDQPRPPDEIPRPVSHYGRSKLEGEGAVLAHRDHLGVTIVRPPAVYGPRDWDMFELFKLVDRRIAPVMGGQKRWLSVIHGEDVARATVACLEAPGEGEVYTVDDGGCYTWEELAQTIAEAMDKKAIRLPLPRAVFRVAATVAEVGGGVLNTTATFNRDKYCEMVQPSWVCGHEAIRRDLGWQPRWNLLDGARQTARWYRENGWL